MAAQKYAMRERVYVCYMATVRCAHTRMNVRLLNSNSYRKKLELEVWQSIQNIYIYIYIYNIYIFIYTLLRFIHVTSIKFNFLH